MTKIYEFSNARAVDAAGTVHLNVNVLEDGVLVQSFPFVLFADPFAGLQAEVQAYVDANPGEIAAIVPPTIEQLRDQATARLVGMLNGMAQMVLQKYPDAEQRLWNDFEREAKVFDMGNIPANDLGDFPTIGAMLTDKLGPPADDGEAKTRIAAVVPGMLANAAGWRMIAAYIAGARAKYDYAIDEAADESALNVLLTEVETEVAARKIAYGLA